MNVATGRARFLAAIIATSALALTACQQGSAPDPGPEMANATPQPSPTATDPDGQVIELPAAWSEVTDMESAGEVLALRSGTTLAVGTIGDFEAGQARELDIDAACGDLTATGDTFVLACGTQVQLIDAADAGQTSRDVSAAAPVTAATLLSSGELIVGNEEEAEVTVFHSDGDTDTISVASPSTQLVSVPVTDGPDAVLRTNNANTTIQDIDWSNRRQGGTLRVGIGVGQVAPGTNGLALVSDASGNQLAVYTTDTVVRLHQTAPVDESPWGVAWDETNELAWIASTALNTITAHDISTGVPLEAHRLNSVADARNIVSLPDGTLVSVSATGDGLQVIDRPTEPSPN